MRWIADQSKILLARVRAAHDAESVARAGGARRAKRTTRNRSDTERWRAEALELLKWCVDERLAPPRALYEAFAELWRTERKGSSLPNRNALRAASLGFISEANEMRLASIYGVERRDQLVRIARAEAKRFLKSGRAGRPFALLPRADNALANDTSLDRRTVHKYRRSPRYVEVVQELIDRENPGT